MRPPITYFCGVNDNILSTIELLASKAAAKEEEANKIKRLVNELCGEAGIKVRYSNIADPSAAISTIRSDQFYGQTLNAAIRNYLERRGAADLGAASVTEIFKAIRDGGYKFETKNEDNAKTSVSNALRLSNSLFHRLPNGDYGLLSWYPSAKAPAEANGSPKSTRKTKRNKQDGRSSNGAVLKAAASDANIVTNKEIRDIILSKQGEFKASDIEGEIKVRFPSKQLPEAKVSSVLFILKKDKGLIKEVSPRTGGKGAVYAKA